MTDACYCDYGDPPAAYSATRRKARRAYRCEECMQQIAPGEQYERAAALYDGSWDVMRTCCRCLAARDYITAHAPCFCWLHGSMLDDAKSTLEQYGHESAGFYIGGMKRVLRAERHKPHNVGGEARLAAHQPSQTTTATPQGVASTDQLGLASEARN